MKIRIHRSSVRWRLSRTDVEALRAHGVVEERVALGGRSLGFRLEVRSAGSPGGASFDGSDVVYRISAKQARLVTATDEEGFEESLPQPDGSAVGMQVQKDYACLHKRRDESDTFPNPAAE